MYKQATAALAALAIAGGALGFVPAAGAQDEFPLADGCILLLEFDPGACDGPPEPTPTPESPWAVDGDFQVCQPDIFDLTNPCDDDEPTPTPQVPVGPQVYDSCGIDPVTLTNTCDHGDDPDDGGDDGDDDGDNPGGDDDDDDGGDDGDEVVHPAEPADPIDGDPNFTG